MKTRAFLLAGCFVLSSCASGGADISTQFINGKYYFMGPNCAQYQMVDANSIQCMDAKGKFTYNATGLTAAQAQPVMQQWAMERAIRDAQRAAQLNALTQQLNATAESFRQSAQAIQQSQPYTAPQVVNPNVADTTKIYCLKAGIYVHCRAKN